ncbi:caskin2 [Symbiodinium sp. CCMP2592]|nr:caskin2 [Symbiodinium sp. CCMP2592]
MGQSLDVLKTCDGTDGRDAKSGSTSTARSGSAVWDDDVMVNCAALEEGVKSVVASANRGGARISDEVLLNHELLQYARQGNLRGVSEALDKGAWTETRRPLVMKPQKPDTGKKGTGDDPAVVGMTPIMFAAQKGSAECVQRLLQARAEVNAVEEDGWSALHFASKEGHLQVCQSLLECKADPGLMNIDEQRPIDVADEEMSFKERFTKICKAMPVFLRGSTKQRLGARQRRLQDAELEALRLTVESLNDADKSVVCPSLRK